MPAYTARRTSRMSRESSLSADIAQQQRIDSHPTLDQMDCTNTSSAAAHESAPGRVYTGTSRCSVDEYYSTSRPCSPGPRTDARRGSGAEPVTPDSDFYYSAPASPLLSSDVGPGAEAAYDADVEALSPPVPKPPAFAVLASREAQATPAVSSAGAGTKRRRSPSPSISPHSHSPGSLGQNAHKRARTHSTAPPNSPLAPQLSPPSLSPPSSAPTSSSSQLPSRNHHRGGGIGRRQAVDLACGGLEGGRLKDGCVSAELLEGTVERLERMAREGWRDGDGDGDVEMGG